MNNYKAYLFAVIAIILWGFSFIWEDILIKNNIEIFAFIFERMVVASLVLWVASILTNKVQKVPLKDLGWLFLLALSEPFIYFIGETIGMKKTGSGVIAAVIVSTIPIFCVFLEKLFYKKKITFLKLLGVVISILGVFFVVYSQEGVHNFNPQGLLILSLAVFGALGYSFLVVKMVRKYNILTIVTWQFTFGAIQFLPLFLIVGVENLTPVFFSLKIQSIILSLAVLCSCICFSLWAFATSKLGVTKTNVFSALIPVVSAIVAHFISDEPITSLKMLGIAIVVAGVIIVQKQNN